MRIENLDPSARRPVEGDVGPCTDLEPSIKGCFEGSASTSKIADAGASMVRVAWTMRAPGTS
ncbi:MAG TPA: hypothetical protein VIE15_04750 [Acidimicrobiales bacterium]|jgi:hypothetical protein